MENNYKNQPLQLLAYLEENGSITGRECMDELGIMNYKGRVCDLRKLGHSIERKWEYGVNRYGRKVKYARYYLRDGKEAANNG